VRQLLHMDCLGDIAATGHNLCRVVRIKDIRSVVMFYTTRTCKHTHAYTHNTNILTPSIHTHTHLFYSQASAGEGLSPCNTAIGTGFVNWLHFTPRSHSPSAPPEAVCLSWAQPEVGLLHLVHLDTPSGDRHTAPNTAQMGGGGVRG